jgi:hypothetical protein
MSADFLTALEDAIEHGKSFYACAETTGFLVSSSLKDVQSFAKKSADSRGVESIIFRLVNRLSTTTGDSYLIAKKFLEPGANGEARILWAMVDTREAAEMMRDISDGPSPYFGVTVQQVIKPDPTIIRE